MILLAVLSVVALVLVGRWLNATKIGGQHPEGYGAFIDAAEAELRQGRVLEQRDAACGGSIFCCEILRISRNGKLLRRSTQHSPG